jgi:hypothetical protein
MPGHAETASMELRRTQQRRVAALLDEIAVRRHHLYVLKAYGVRRAGMSPLKGELTAVRAELAQVTGAATTSWTGPSDVSTREPDRQIVGARRPSAAGSTREKPANLGARRRSSAGRALHS